MLSLAGVLAVRVLEPSASEREAGSVLLIRTTGLGGLRNH